MKKVKRIKLASLAAVALLAVPAGMAAVPALPGIANVGVVQASATSVNLNGQYGLVFGSFPLYAGTILYLNVGTDGTPVDPETPLTADDTFGVVQGYFINNHLASVKVEDVGKTITGWVAASELPDFPEDGRRADLDAAIQLYAMADNVFSVVLGSGAGGFTGKRGDSFLANGILLDQYKDVSAFVQADKDALTVIQADATNLTTTNILDQEAGAAAGKTAGENGLPFNPGNQSQTYIDAYTAAYKAAKADYDAGYAAGKADKEDGRRPSRNPNRTTAYKNGYIKGYAQATGPEYPGLPDDNDQSDADNDTSGDVDNELGIVYSDYQKVPIYQDKALTQNTGKTLDNYINSWQVLDVAKDSSGTITAYQLGTNQWVKAADMLTAFPATLKTIPEQEVYYSDNKAVSVYTDPLTKYRSGQHLNTNINEWRIFEVALNDQDAPIAFRLGAHQWVKASEMKETYPLSGIFKTTQGKTLYNLDGQKTGTIAATDSYKVFAVTYFNGRQAVRLGNNNQWIFARDGAYYPD